MKLELKHLAPYLPYGLKFRVSETNSILDDFTSEMLALNTSDNVFLKSGVYDFDIDDYIKPILRNLSDLTNEIEINGEKFVPLIKLTGFNTEKRYSRIVYEVKNNYMSYYQIQKLFEWHFDVFGLIEKGLAIDKNTL